MRGLTPSEWRGSCSSYKETTIHSRTCWRRGVREQGRGTSEAANDVVSAADDGRLMPMSPGKCESYPGSSSA